jgi:hypothetical protein
MTQRLPIPSEDLNDWGVILNDYLSVSLNADGTLNSAAVAIAIGSSGSFVLPVGTTISASTTLNVNTYTPVNAGSSPLTQTLPTGAASGNLIAVEKTDSSTNVVTVSGSIRDVPSSSLTLSLAHETIIFEADPSGSWWPIASHKTLGSLDARYLASPIWTGTPTAPTAAPGTSTTQVATTAFVAVSFALLASPAFTGNPTAPTQTALNNSTRVATTAYTDTAIGVETTRATTAEALLAPKAGPALTGTPTAPTAGALTNNTQLATTAYTDSAITAATTATLTLTNKRVTKRVLALSANSATPAINTDNYDVLHITAQTATITGFTITGTPVDGDTLRISITGTAAVPFTLTGTYFEASTVALPTTTVTTARLDMEFYWNTATSKWRIVKAA